MRLLLLFSLLFSSLTGFSQLVMVDATELSGDIQQASIGSTFEVTNSGSETAQFYWDLVRPADMPAEWEFTVCDAVLCLPEGVESSLCDDPSLINVLDPGQTISYYKVSLNTNGIAGNHPVEFRLTSVCGDVTQADVLATQTITFSVSGGSSTESLLDVNSILIYPNPTSDRFQINEDTDITNISIYNIVGKQIASDSHFAGKSHDISDLDKGIYLVRMLDAAQDVVKVLRLTKE